MSWISLLAGSIIFIPGRIRSITLTRFWLTRAGPERHCSWQVEPFNKRLIIDRPNTVLSCILAVTNLSTTAGVNNRGLRRQDELVEQNQTSFLVASARYATFWQGAGSTQCTCRFSRGLVGDTDNGVLSSASFPFSLLHIMCNKCTGPLVALQSGSNSCSTFREIMNVR